MHWLAYRIEGGRVVWLRIIRADQRPQDVNILNDGFMSEQEALNLMAHYLEPNEAGFLTIPPERVHDHVTRLQRIGMALAIEPLLFYGLMGAYGMIGVVLFLLLLHLMGGG